jgi:hypothetical protein
LFLPNLLLAHDVLAELLFVQLEEDGTQRLQVVDPLDDPRRLVQRNDSLKNENKIAI